MLKIYEGIGYAQEKIIPDVSFYLLKIDQY